MSALPTPRLADLDDPLAPRREAERPAPTSVPPRRRARSPKGASTAPAARAPIAAPAPVASLADEQLIGVFARLPESLADRLAEGVRALNADRPRRSRVTQQDIVGALVEHHVTPERPSELGELVDAYRQRLRR
jgi:hypothetical protein